MSAAREAARVELRWYFTEGDGALGLKGIDYNRGGGRRDGAGAARSYESAVAREVEVRRRLADIDVQHQQVLRAAFVPKPWPRVYRGWYDVAGVAAMMVDRSNVLEAARRIMLLGSEGAGDLRILANALLTDALGAFVGEPPIQRERSLPAMPKVPLLKVAKEDPRTWAPIELTPPLQGRLCQGTIKGRSVIVGRPNRRWCEVGPMSQGRLPYLAPIPGAACEGCT